MNIYTRRRDMGALALKHTPSSIMSVAIVARRGFGLRIFDINRSHSRASSSAWMSHEYRAKRS